jgi:hypothetical protein
VGGRPGAGDVNFSTGEDATNLTVVPLGHGTIPPRRTPTLLVQAAHVQRTALDSRCSQAYMIR